MIPVTDALAPVVANLKVLRGLTYKAEIELWANPAHTEPFSLTGWTVTLDPKPLPLLTVGAGLAVVGNVVTVSLVPARTAAYPVDDFHYVLAVEKGETRLAPVVGALTVEDP